ncbi:predicted protein [Nematostella vectensis]|uniref:Peptidase M14 domain-containing protein n=1 Tax=Nematostella vectensis TaxID=45351 RepID=A7RNN0_NEMVE|nr:predicted protein [Nematostella vectensis]|eukprot:XP_001639019.1 predicted protein [Nematostella vectensis]
MADLSQVLSCAVVFASDRVVRVRPVNDNHVTLLSGLEESQPFNVDFWTFPSNPGKTVDIHVGARDFYTLKAWLHSQGMEFTSRDLQGIASQAVNAQKQQTFADRPVLSCAVVFASDRVVRVRPANDNHVTLLSGLEESQPFNVDFWTFPSNPGKTVDIHVGARDFYTLKAWLHSQGMEFTSRDLQGIASQAANAQKQQTFADRPGNLAWFKKYHQHDEIIAELKRIAKGAKNRTQLLSIGNSYEKREQLVIRINGTNGKYKADKPVFFVNCGIHAREWVSPATCMYIIHELVSKYEKDAKVTSVLDKMDFIIHPMVNPDGYVFTHKNV